MNSVSFIGRLTADPTARKTKDGVPIASMRIAIPVFRNGDESAIFVDVTDFDRQADLPLEHLSNGRKVGIDGRLDFREWEDDEGNRRTALFVIAGLVDFLDSPPAASPPEATASGGEGRRKRRLAA